MSCLLLAYTWGLLFYVLYNTEAHKLFEFISGYGGSDGMPELVTMFDDIPIALEKLNIPQRDLIIFGRSVGTIYAIECAKQFPNIAGLVLESGVATPLERVISFRTLTQ